MRAASVESSAHCDVKPCSCNDMGELSIARASKWPVGCHAAGANQVQASRSKRCMAVGVIFILIRGYNPAV